MAIIKDLSYISHLEIYKNIRVKQLQFCTLYKKYVLFSQYVEPRPGNFIDIDTQKIVGTHKGNVQKVVVTMFFKSTMFF